MKKTRFLLSLLVLGFFYGRLLLRMKIKAKCLLPRHLSLVLLTHLLPVLLLIFQVEKLL